MLNRKFNEEKFLKKAKKFDKFEIFKYKEYDNYLNSTASLVDSNKLGLKVIVISDTHGTLDNDKNFIDFINALDNYDLCFLLGDHTSSDIEVILKYIKKDKIIGVLGNHNIFDIYNQYDVKFLNGNTFEYKNIKIAGISGTFKYKDSNILKTQYESLDLSNRMPQAADILITHDISIEFNNDIVHIGLIGIKNYIYKNNVKYHFHGHVHQNYSKLYNNNCKEISVYKYKYYEI